MVGVWALPIELLCHLCQLCHLLFHFNAVRHHSKLFHVRQLCHLCQVCQMCQSKLKSMLSINALGPRISTWRSSLCQTDLFKFTSKVFEAASSEVQKYGSWTIDATCILSFSAQSSLSFINCYPLAPSSILSFDPICSWRGVLARGGWGVCEGPPAALPSLAQALWLPLLMAVTLASFRQGRVQILGLS